ncbi:hypothetical protein [Lysinibacillus sp. ZYM-1]|uniref:hypothetical protein n=1 Tax=Lysinibacillus sp. ZYM-1 TaxID=1681184 RepID=UPI0006CE6B2E|nr:hypothetical protein [Lysinibacillus sp. ZYM-1]KPN89452.1 hypothetical protein AO843_08450 [Lysinibacillus sp. ZYM-1]
MKTKVFTTNGTFVVPAGVTEVYLTGGGAGGGGGGYSNVGGTATYHTGATGGATSFGTLLTLPGGAGGATGNASITGISQF